MPCLIALIAFFTPRIALTAIFLLTNWFSRAFETTIWPLLGFLFMPYTTLVYLATMLNNNHQVSGGWVVLLIVAVLIDLGHHGGISISAKKSR